LLFPSSLKNRQTMVAVGAIKFLGITGSILGSASRTVLSLPKMPSGANAFEISSIEDVETGGA